MPVPARGRPSLRGGARRGLAARVARAAGVYAGAIPLPAGKGRVPLTARDVARGKAGMPRVGRGGMAESTIFRPPAGPNSAYGKASLPPSYYEERARLLAVQAYAPPALDQSHPAPPVGAGGAGSAGATELGAREARELGAGSAGIGGLGVNGASASALGQGGSSAGGLVPSKTGQPLMGVSSKVARKVIRPGDDLTPMPNPLTNQPSTRLRDLREDAADAAEEWELIVAELLELERQEAELERHERRLAEASGGQATLGSLVATGDGQAVLPPPAGDGQAVPPPPAAAGDGQAVLDPPDAAGDGQAMLPPPAAAGDGQALFDSQQEHVSFHATILGRFTHGMAGFPDPRADAVIAGMQEIMDRQGLSSWREPNPARRHRLLARSVEYYLVQTGDIAPSTTVVKVRPVVPAPYY